MNMKIPYMVFLFLLINPCIGWKSPAKFTANCPISTVQSNLFIRVSYFTTIIDLASCEIEVVNENAFKNLRYQKEIHLEKNYITDVVEGTFQSNPQLTYINLGCNEIGELKNGVFSKLVSIIELYLDRNRIVFIGENVFRNMHALKRLVLSNNKISTLNNNLFDNNNNLLELNLADNKLENLNINVFKNVNKLKELYLQYNRLINIKREHFLNLIHLEELNLSFNNIQGIAFGSFSNTKSLRKLWLNDNQIFTLSEHLFLNLTHLKYLHINNNLLIHLGVDSFPSTARLIELYLDQNKLRHLDPITIHQLQAVTELTLHNNPWWCDCSLTELYNIWQNRSKYSNPQCSEPVHLQNVSWANLSTKDFCPVLLLTENKQSINAVVDNNVSFTCSTNTQQVRWLHRNTTIHADSVSASGQRYNVHSKLQGNILKSILTITQVQIEDGGIYTCEADSSDEFQKNDIALNIIGSHTGTMWQILGPVLVALLILMGIIMSVVVKKYVLPKSTKQLTTVPNIYTSGPIYDEIKMSSDKAESDQDGYMIPKCMNH